MGMCRSARFTYAYPYIVNCCSSLLCNVGLTCNLKKKLQYAPQNTNNQCFNHFCLCVKICPYELLFLYVQNSKFVRTLFAICTYEFLFANRRLHDKELVDASSSTCSEYFLIMQPHVPYVVFTLYSLIYMTMTTRCRHYDTLASWLRKLCVITMKILSLGYETVAS
jgi:hypothetical protein